MIRKTALVLICWLYLANFLLTPAYATEGLIKPTSRFYFLKSWTESVRLFLSFSKEQKVNYLLQLTDKRVAEMKEAPRQEISDRYDRHFRQLEQLATQVENKSEISAKIEEASLRQQEELTRTYHRVPQQAKEVIGKAQENTAASVAKAIEKIEGAQAAQAYINQVEKIQQFEAIGQEERLEPVPMEADPNADPSQSVSNKLKESQGLKTGQELRPLLPVFDEQSSGGEGRMEPATPLKMNAPVGQN